MTPSPSDSSPLEALRQLKALLDQGAITPAEYDTLKQRLLSAPPAAGPATATTTTTFSAADSVPPPVPVEPAASVSPPAAGAVPVSSPPTGNAELPSLLDMFQSPPAGSPPAPTQAPAPTPPAAPYVPPTPPLVAEPVATRTVPVAPVVVSPPTAFPAAQTAADVSFLPGAAAGSAAATVAPALPATPDFRPPPAPLPRYSEPAPAFVPQSLPSPAPAPPAFSDLLNAPLPPRDRETVVPAAAPDFTPESGSELEPEPEPARPTGRALPTALLLLGGLALLLLLGYLFMGRDQTDEHLTSRSRTAADSVAVRPEVGPQDEPLSRPPAAASEPEVVRGRPAEPAVFPTRPDSTATGRRAATQAAPAGGAVEEEPVFPGSSAPAKPAAVPAPAPASAPVNTPAAVPAAAAEPAVPAGPATAPEDGDDEATTSVRGALGRFYADLQATPFNASQHFAPTVERLYTRQNLTPAAIEEDLNRSMFPEFRQRVTRIVPGTLRVGPPAADGTRTATYTEQSRAFRVSKNQFQRTRTQVRVRFNPAYKMTYMRQEKLLENTFE